MKSNQRLMLAVALSAVIMLLFTFLNRKVQVEEEKKAASAAVEKREMSQTQEETRKAVSRRVKPLNTKIESSTEVKTIILSNDLTLAVFSSENAVLKSFKLIEHSLYNGGKVEIVERSYGNLEPFYLSFINLTNSLALNEKALYSVLSQSETNIAFAIDIVLDGKETRVIKNFSLNGYLLDVDITFVNNSDSQVDFDYSLILGSGVGPYRSGALTREDYVRIDYLKTGSSSRTQPLARDAKLGELKYENTRKKNGIVEPTEWIALENRYFAAFLSAPRYDYLAEMAMFTEENDKGEAVSYHTASYSAPLSIQSGMSITERYSAYLGPKQRSILPDYARHYEYIFSEKFLFINIRPLVFALNWCLNIVYNFTKNYGLAIILLTVLYKVITFPLAQKSYDSMKKMQMLNPRIEEIRTQYKNHPEKMNAEIMNLYKKEKISPLSGCLPMLIPLPILIGFFYLMQNMIELRNVPFLWISDLTSSDSLFTLPFQLPILDTNQFNLLPLIMTVTTFFSMRMQPQNQVAQKNNDNANTMKMMGYFFPVFLLFILYNFASGLILYYTMMNILSLIQQLITNKFKKEHLVTVIEPKNKKK